MAPIPGPEQLGGLALAVLDRAAAAAESTLAGARDTAEGAAEAVAAAGANAWDATLRGGVADLRPTPRSIIEEEPHRTLYRYRSSGEARQHAAPVLLVPPLAAPTSCFDLRRGCSLAAHLLAHGHPTYLLDYGRISFSDRDLGLEHWIEDVLPRSIERVSQDVGRPVQLVGWCLGGIMSLLSVAAAPELPVRSVATVASPFDFTRVRLMSPIRPLADLTGGRIITTIYRTLGGAPAPVVRAAYRAAALDKYLTKPYVVARRLADRDFLAQIEAVDAFTADMIAYPGRTFGQLYHRFFIVNELAQGKLNINRRTIDLADVRVPVLSVAGSSDTLAPRPAVHHVAEVLPNAPRVELRTAPGGHLGVLTGRSARDTTWRHLDDFLRSTDPAAVTPSEAAEGAAA